MRKQIDIHEAVDRTIKHLSNLPKGTEISTREALEQIGYFDLLMDVCLIIDSQVRKLVEHNGLILDDSPYEDTATGLPCNNLYCVRAKEGKLSGIETINVTDWLKKTYGESLNPALVSVAFCQSSEEVWLNIEYGYESQYGVVTRGKSVHLDFIEHTSDKTYDPDNDIEKNVAMFAKDEDLLVKTTLLIREN